MESTPKTPPVPEMERLERKVNTLTKLVKQMNKLLAQRSEIMTLPQVAEFLNVTPNIIYSWVNNGKIPFAKIGKRLMFSKNELELWLLAEIRDRQPEATLDFVRKLLNNSQANEDS